MADISMSYPYVVSKSDPLIIRVSELTLLVGSTTYSAKIKQGSPTIFNGFYIFVSGLGEPIARVPIDSSSYSNEDISGLGSDSYNYVKSQASLWINNLQESFLHAESQKNAVDLLNELKCQLHYDITGNSSLYTDGMNVDMSAIPLSTKLDNMNKELQDLNVGINNMNKVITEMSTNVSNVADRTRQVADRLAGSETTLGDMINDAVNSALTSIMGKFTEVLTDTDTIINSLGELPKDGSTVHGYLRNTIYSVVNSTYNSVGPAATSGSKTLQEYLRNVINTTLNNTLDSVGTAPSSGTPNRSLQSYIRNIVARSDEVSNVQDTVNAIRNVDVPDIKTTIGDNSSGSAVSEVSSVVNGIWDMVAGLSRDNINHVADVLCQDDAVQILYDALWTETNPEGDTVSYIRTETSRDNLIWVDPSDDKIKAIRAYVVNT